LLQSQSAQIISTFHQRTVVAEISIISNVCKIDCDVKKGTYTLCSLCEANVKSHVLHLSLQIPVFRLSVVDKTISSPILQAGRHKPAGHFSNKVE
jgi:hypothetical protein